MQLNKNAWKTQLGQSTINFDR